MSTACSDLLIKTLYEGQAGLWKATHSKQKAARLHCAADTREQHMGNEVNLWKNYGVDLRAIALSLFAATGDCKLAGEITADQART